MRLRLSPGQGCYLHGWMTPKLTLTWGDVLLTPTMTLQKLLSAGLTPCALHQLQPDASAWAKAGRVTLAECPSMQDPWGAHPIRDFSADLGDIIAQRWSAEVMHGMGLTFADLVDIGLTQHNMALFTHITLRGWAVLGFSRADADRIPHAVLARLFDNMTKADIIRSLK